MKKLLLCVLFSLSVGIYSMENNDEAKIIATTLQAMSILNKRMQQETHKRDLTFAEEQEIIVDPCEENIWDIVRRKKLQLFLIRDKA